MQIDPIVEQLVSEGRDQQAGDARPAKACASGKKEGMVGSGGENDQQ